jgi:hypothetical protein
MQTLSKSKNQITCLFQLLWNPLTSLLYGYHYLHFLHHHLDWMKMQTETETDDSHSDSGFDFDL